jgi:hypothetical protein
VVANLSRKLRDWLLARRVTRAFVDHIMVDGWQPQIGTLEAYADYQKLLEVAETFCKQSGQRCDIELTPQLVGLEGKRVEVIDADGEKRRFIVGKSTGWQPIHLEIPSARSSGGPAAMGTPYKSVRVLLGGRR